MVVLALLLGACATTDAESLSTSTTAIAPSTTIDNDLVGQPAGRALLAYLYQLAIADAGCDPPRDLSLVEPIGVAGLGVGVNEVFDALHDVGGTCADPSAWTRAMTALVSAIDDLDRLARQDGGDPPHRYESLPSTDDPVELGPFVVRSIERLHHTLLGRHPIGASRMWFSSQHLGLSAHLRQAAVDGSVPDAVVVGSSVGYRGIDADALGDALETTVLNASMVGASVAAVHEWLAELRRFGAGTEHIIWAINTHELHECTSPARFTDPSSMRDIVFGPIAATAPGDRLDWVLGPAGAPVSDRSPIGDDWLRRFADNDPALYETDPNVLARHRTELERYRAPEVCVSELESVVSAVETAVAAGARVTIVAMPIHDEVIDAHPDGVDGHTAALTSLAGLVGPSAEIIDYTDGWGDELFVDLFHLGALGRAELSAELAVALRGG